MILAADAPAKQILNLRLVSPFLSEGDDTILELPVNIPIEDIPLSGEITYADGKRTIPLDETLKPYIYVLPIEIEILQNQQYIFNQNIIGYVRAHSRNSSLSEGKDAHPA
jgi:hypothetical protein